MVRKRNLARRLEELKEILEENEDDNSQMKIKGGE